MIRLIALDLDGTMLDPAGQVTQQVKSAIAQARSSGVKVVLSTGRSGQEAADFVCQAGCDPLAVCLGGAALIDTETQTQLRRWDMPPESGRRALALCLDREIELMIFAGDQILLDPFSKQSQLRTFPCEAFHRAAVVTDDPLAYLQRHRLPVTKIHGDWNPAAYPLKELSALPGVELTSSNGHDFELLPAGVDKGRALALLAMLYGVALEECAAVGDNENDLSMFRAVGMPIAMGNASPAAKRAAARTVADNAHNGAAQAVLSCLEGWREGGPCF